MMGLLKQIWFPTLFSVVLLAFQLVNLLGAGSGLFFLRTVIVGLGALATLVLLIKVSAFAFITAGGTAFAWVGWLFWISYRNSVEQGIPMSTTLPIELTVVGVALFYVWTTYIAVKNGSPIA